MNKKGRLFMAKEIIRECFLKRVPSAYGLRKWLVYRKYNQI
jgi:hypothetical protein